MGSRERVGELEGFASFTLLPCWEQGKLAVVRVIARATLTGFVRNRAPQGQQNLVKAHLDAWYQETAQAVWKNTAELKKQFGSASILTSERVVFNIKGNDYRLIASINYDYRLVRVKWLGTHKEYDTIDAKEVPYDKKRYSDSTNS
jgi:mRNA interferase HigB